MLISFFLFSSVVASALPFIPSPRATGTKYLISFGDSYSQTGFSLSGNAPSAANPLGNPNLQGYTTTGGLNWIGDLVEKLNTSTTLSYDFASGGATVDASLVAPYATTVLSLIDQVRVFTSNSIARGPWSSSNTLFGFWIGINDVGNAAGSANWSTLLGQIMDQYFAQAQIVYNTGGRNFLFLTVPPTNLTPMFIAQGSAKQAVIANAISSYNSAIWSRTAAFQSSHSGSQVWVYDTNGPFTQAINNPTAYGARDATCYNSDGVSCLWWNNYHAGQAIHKLVAQGVAQALRGVFF